MLSGGFFFLNKINILVINIFFSTNIQCAMFALAGMHVLCGGLVFIYLFFLRSTNISKMSYVCTGRDACVEW